MPSLIAKCTGDPVLDPPCNGFFRVLRFAGEHGVNLLRGGRLDDAP